MQIFTPIILNRITAFSNRTVRIAAIILLIINALNALAAGFSFIVDPSGKGLRMTTDYLKHTPFPDFLIPGIILFVANGVLSGAIAVYSIRKSKYYPWLIAFQGAILTGWIVIQLLLLRFFHPLHLIMGAIGIILIVMGSALHKQARLIGETVTRKGYITDQYHLFL